MAEDLSANNRFPWQMDANHRHRRRRPTIRAFRPTGTASRGWWAFAYNGGDRTVLDAMQIAHSSASPQLLRSALIA